MVHILDGGGFGIRIPHPPDNPPKIKPGKGGSNKPPASLKAMVGNYTHPAGTGNFNITGHNFTPKAVINFGVGAGLWDTEDGALVLGFGAATSPTERWAVAVLGTDNDGTQDGADAMAQRNMIQITASPSDYTWQSELVSFNSNGFTLNAVENDFPGAIEQYLTLGGNSLQAKCGYKDVPAGTGNLSVTGVGFQPDVVILFGYGASNNPPPQFNGGGVHFGIGAFDSAGRQWCSYIANADLAGTSDTARYFSNAKCLAGIEYSVLGSLGPVQGVCSFVSMDADGFTINRDTDVGGQRKFGWLALKGLRARVDTFVAPSSLGTSVITAPGFRPAAVILAGNGIQLAGLGTKTDHSYMDISAIASNGSRSVTVFDQDALGTSRAKRWMSQTYVGSVRDTGGIFLRGIGSLTSQGFNVAWSEVSGSPYVGYIALG